MAYATNDFGSQSTLAPRAGQLCLTSNSGAKAISVDVGAVAPSKTYLSPVFANIPNELVKCHRWVVWLGKKVPRDAKRLNRAASSIDPNTWSAFEQAQNAYEKGGFLGIGFALNGDGIVGVDIDNCVVDGKPSAQALAVVESLGCQYVELSPSGNGLRSFGFVDNPPLIGRRRKFEGMQVELYATGQYLTVTGHVIQSGPLVQLTGFLKLYEQLNFTEETEVKEETEAIDFCSSVACLDQVHGLAFPSDTIPTDIGQRNECIFKLARHLKLKYPNADVESMMEVMAQWHQQVLPAIRTKDFMESWAGFRRSWRNVKYPSGIMDKIVAEIDQEPPNNPGSAFGLQGARLYQLCSGLQIHQGAEPFFLSCRQAGKALQISHTFANDLLSEFCHMGLMTRTFQGTNKKASRYLMNGLLRA